MTRFCMWVDIQTQSRMQLLVMIIDQLRGLGVARGRISHFPIDLRRRPYNTLALLCECVMWGLDIILIFNPKRHTCA